MYCTKLNAIYNMVPGNSPVFYEYDMKCCFLYNNIASSQGKWAVCFNFFRPVCSFDSLKKLFNNQEAYGSYLDCCVATNIPV